MKKVTEKVMRAFLVGKSCTVGNTSTDGKIVTLHGNTILQRGQNGTVLATLAGWPTVTTRERLNGFCQICGLGSLFSQKQGQQLYRGKPIASDVWVEVPVNIGG